MVEPSAHALALAGTDLASTAPPFVRVGEAREVVVVLSRSRDPMREVYLDRCAADHVPVVVRPSGGGAVVLAPGAVVASAVHCSAPAHPFPHWYFRRFCAAVARALAACGVTDVTPRGVSDLCLGDRKIAGSSLRLWHERVLFQVSLLVGMDIGLTERYLRFPSRAPDYRAGRSHREFVTSLWEAGYQVSTSRVVAALSESMLAEVRGARPASFEQESVPAEVVR